MESYKYDVFISYSRRDTNVVEKICKAFDDNKISYFIDRQGIGGGLEFPKVIAEAILSSQIFLFIASENSYKSKFAQSEVVFAFNKKQKSDIIPYIIDDSALPSELELTFSATIWRRKSKHPIETTLVDDVLKRVGKTKIVEEEGKHEGLRSYEKCNVPFTFDVFISYSRKDYVDDAGNVLGNNILSKIKDTLKANGISYWFDEEGIYSGDEFASVLTNAIRNSRIFLFISSVNSNKSKWTSNEISTAHEFKKPIIPFRIDNSPYNDSVMMKIISLDYIECKDEQKAINKLLRAVEHILPLSKKDNMRQEEIVKGKTEDYSSSGVEVHIDVDADCDLYRFKTFIQHLIAGEDNVLHMNHGKYKLEFVSTDFPEVKSNMVYNLATGITCDFIEIAIKEKINGFISKQKTEGLKCKSGKKDKITINAFSPYDDIEEKQYDIFICFRRESGRNLARIFQLSLEKKYRVFMDYNALPYNEFELSVADIIRKSSVFLLILSKGSLDRCVYENDWVRKEILYAEQFGCHIVPVVVDDSFEGLPESLPEELHHSIASLQWSNVHMGSLFDVSLDKLVHDRIAPHIHCKKTTSYTDVRKLNNTEYSEIIEPSSIVMSESPKSKLYSKMAMSSPSEGHKVFVSYSHKNIEKARLFCEQMDNLGISYWIDYAGIYSGTVFKKILVDAIKSSQVILFLSSQESNRSQSVIKEISLAVSDNKTILPIKLDDAPYAKSIRFDLCDIDWIDYSEDKSEEAMEKFRYSLQLYLH